MPRTSETVVEKPLQPSFPPSARVIVPLEPVSALAQSLTPFLARAAGIVWRMVSQSEAATGCDLAADTGVARLIEPTAVRSSRSPGGRPRPEQPPSPRASAAAARAGTLRRFAVLW